MVIVKVIGGLGNQMFQYALYRALELQGKDVYLDISACLNYKRHNGYELQRVFNISPKIATKNQIQKLKEKPLSIQKETVSYLFEPCIFDAEDMYLDAYWQNEAYFKSIRETILHDFLPLDKLKWRNKKLLNLIKTESLVSIHVRRGDYVKKKDAALRLGGICTLTYYKNAIHYIKENVANPRFIIFSDDIRWCKKHLSLGPDSIYVSWNRRRNSFKDLLLMSQCSHNVIANSSFSWWAAWLNSHAEKMVISPNKWFNNDPYESQLKMPPGWVTLNTK